MTFNFPHDRKETINSNIRRYTATLLIKLIYAQSFHDTCKLLFDNVFKTLNVLKQVKFITRYSVDI